MPLPSERGLQVDGSEFTGVGITIRYFGTMVAVVLEYGPGRTGAL